MQKEPKTEQEEKQADQNREETLYRVIRESKKETKSCYYKAKRYFSKWKSIVSTLTLIFVGAYTLVTFDIFFVGSRAMIYFDRAIIEIAEKPVPPESNGLVTVFNGPWVTHKVVTFNVLLTNAGNTSTRNMRVVLDCRPIAFFELQKGDPFTNFKWNETIAHPEIVGPKQTIRIGPCEAETTADTILNAQMGIVPIILMGEIRYEDRVAWGPWTHHVTQFAQRVVIDRYDLNGGKIEATTQSIGSHNCADDCP